MEETISVTKFDLIILKRLYKKAVEDGKEQFVWKGRDVLTDYAKYLIQHLDGEPKMKIWG